MISTFFKKTSEATIPSKLNFLLMVATETLLWFISAFLYKSAPVNFQFILTSSNIFFAVFYPMTYSRPDDFYRVHDPLFLNYLIILFTMLGSNFNVFAIELTLIPNLFIPIIWPLINCDKTIVLFLKF